MTLGDRPHMVDKDESFFLVERQNIEAGKAIVRIAQVRACVFSAEKPGRERAPHRETQAVMLHHRNHIALHIAAEERVIHLAVSERSEAVRSLKLECGGDL